MKAIMVMFDSLNRRMLSPYGCDWVHTPNFNRLTDQTVVFEKAFVGSMPCMPARRELHTGRYNFLHRSWGPIEPYDRSMPELLFYDGGVHTHLVSDHFHYWNEGGATYHTRYTTWQNSRGQSGDGFIGDLNTPDFPFPNPHKTEGYHYFTQDWVNRVHIKAEAQWPQAKTFEKGLEFLDLNHKCDNWFLQIETFDPHEPFCVPERYKELYDYDFSKFSEDWPTYRKFAEEDRELIEHYRFLQAALTSMCDNHLGKVLDAMDKYNLWDDTMLIVNTDHGFMLGEHQCVGKNWRLPYYNEIVNIPFFVWDPRTRKKAESRKSLVQTIDIAPTLMDFFGMEIPEEMQGVPLGETVENDKSVRDAGIFGVHGGSVNCTDGRYVYLRKPVENPDAELYEYTLMPAHMKHTFSVKELQDIQLAEPFSFTRGCRLMKIAAMDEFIKKTVYFENLLFDIEEDYSQQFPLDDEKIENDMIRKMIKIMRKNDSPPEQFVRLGLENYNNEETQNV